MPPEGLNSQPSKMYAHAVGSAASAASVHLNLKFLICQSVPFFSIRADIDIADTLVHSPPSLLPMPKQRERRRLHRCSTQEAWPASSQKRQ